MMPTILFAVLLISVKSMEAQESYLPSDFLPLEVGNSWTYEHRIGGRRIDPADLYNHPLVHGGFRDVFTISVEGEEVIDGKAYYVFSDVKRNWPPLPPHFLAGKRLRWEGDALIERTEGGDRSLFRLFEATDERAYSIPSAEGDRSVSVHGGRLSVPWREYELTGDKHGSRRVRFLAGFGMRSCEWTIDERSGDGLSRGAEFRNKVLLLEATIQGRTKDYDDALWSRGSLPDSTTSFFSVQEGDIWIFSLHSQPSHGDATTEIATIVPVSKEIDGEVYWRLDTDSPLHSWHLWQVVSSLLACTGDHFRVDEEGRVFGLRGGRDEEGGGYGLFRDESLRIGCPTEGEYGWGEVFLYDFNFFNFDPYTDPDDWDEWDDDHWDEFADRWAEWDDWLELDERHCLVPTMIPYTSREELELRPDRLSFTHICSWSSAPRREITFHRGLGIREIRVSSYAGSERYTPIWVRIGGREWGLHPGPEYPGYGHADYATDVVVQEEERRVTGLGANSPNPFNRSTHISYSVSADGPASLVVYNLVGQPVHTLAEGYHQAGSHTVSWHPSDRMAAGVYLCRLTTSAESLLGKLTYLP